MILSDQCLEPDDPTGSTSSVAIGAPCAVAPTIDRRSECCLDRRPSTGPPRGRRSLAWRRGIAADFTTAHPDVQRAPPPHPLHRRPSVPNEEMGPCFIPSPLSWLCLVEDYACTGRMQLHPPGGRSAPLSGRRPPSFSIGNGVLQWWCLTPVGPSRAGQKYAATWENPSRLRTVDRIGATRGGAHKRAAWRNFGGVSNDAVDRD
jgi:hypothetical protein